MLVAQEQAKVQLMQTKKRIKDIGRSKKELKGEIDSMTEEMNSKLHIVQQQTEGE
jgi:hypothetical protein